MGASMVLRENAMADNIRDFQANYIELAADIVAAYVSNNSVPVTALAELLSNVHAAVSGLAIGGNGALAEDKIQKATPAQIKKSITPDHLISFEDGKPYKTIFSKFVLLDGFPILFKCSSSALMISEPMSWVQHSNLVIDPASLPQTSDSKIEVSRLVNFRVIKMASSLNSVFREWAC